MTTTPSIYDTREYRRLLCGVLANPADDLARLVLADWLEEQGEAERAEFIRVQVRLNHLVEFGQDASVMHRHYAGQRQSELTEARTLQSRERQFVAVILQDLPFGCDWLLGTDSPIGHGFFATIQRGFSFYVRCTLAEWDKFAPQLVTRHPIETVNLIDGRLEHVPREPGFPEWRVRFPSDICTHYFNFSMSKDTEKELSQWAIQRAIFAALPVCPNDRCGKPITVIHRGMAKCPCGFAADLWQHLLGLTKDEE